MLTLILILIPFAGSLACMLVSGKNAKNLALSFTLIQLIVTLYIASQFIPGSGIQFSIDYWWIQNLGISFKAGLDGISLLLVLLTGISLPLIILSSRDGDIVNPKSFYGLILFMQAALIGVFTSLDGFLFYVFWELALIPIYFICLLWGGKDRIKITLKFFIYTLSGSLLMLVGLIYIYLQTPAPHSFNINALYAVSLNSEQQSLLFWSFFLAFAIKIPIFPLDTWQPDTYTDAPTQGSMLLAGVMLKMGLFGIIRWLLPVVPLGIAEWGKLAIILCVTGIVYASCMALIQKDFKRLIAYSSIAHVGLIAAGIFSFNIQGMQGAMIQMMSHGINVIGLFFIADIIMSRMKTRQLDELGGIANHAGQFSVFYLIILLGSVALPLTNGFIGEFLLLNGVYQYSSIAAAVAGLTVILGAVYMLRSYQMVMLGGRQISENVFTSLSASELTTLFIISLLIIIIGVYPQPLLHLTEPDIKLILNHAALH
jgi:NADH-quinone oxidoreductase subunit M